MLLIIIVGVFFIYSPIQLTDMKLIGIPQTNAFIINKVSSEGTNVK